VALATETDVRIKIWARVRLGGERGVRVAQEYGYQNGSGVGQVVRRLQQQSQSESVKLYGKPLPPIWYELRSKSGNGTNQGKVERASS
jgi:hypothetical protein